MDRTESTTARLRRAFHYPADDDADSTDSQPEAIDEEEQERLIARLSAENASRNATFRIALLGLPLLTAIPYLSPLFHPPTALPALLSLSCLACTAFLVYSQPPSVTGIAPLDAWTQKGDVRGAAGDTQRLFRLRSGLRGGSRGGSGGSWERGTSPLQVYVPYLNLGLAAVLALMGRLSKGAGIGSIGFIGLGNLPGLVYVVVLVAKVVMGSVDPERELSALKYEYKGA